MENLIIFKKTTINKIIECINTIDANDKHRVGTFVLREIHRECGRNGLSESYVKFEFLANEFKISGQGLGFYNWKGINESNIMDVETTLKIEVLSASTRVGIRELIQNSLKDLPEAETDFTLRNFFYRNEAKELI